MTARFLSFLFGLQCFFSYSQSFYPTENEDLDSTIKHHYPYANQDLVDTLIGHGLLKVVDPSLYLGMSIEISGKNFYQVSPSKRANDMFRTFEEEYVDNEYSISTYIDALDSLGNEPWNEPEVSTISCEQVPSLMYKDLWNFTRLKLYPQKKTRRLYENCLIALLKKEGVRIGFTESIPEYVNYIQQDISTENRVEGYLLLFNSVSPIPDLIMPHLDSIRDAINEDHILTGENKALLYVALAKLYNSVDYDQRHIQSINLLQTASTYLNDANASIEKRLAVEVLIAKSLSVLPGIEPREFASERLSEFYLDNTPLMNKSQRMKCLTMQLYFESIAYETRQIETHNVSRPIETYMYAFAVHKYFQENPSHDEFELYSVINMMKAQIRDQEYTLVEPTGAKTGLRFFSRFGDMQQEMPSNFRELNIMTSSSSLYLNRVDSWYTQYKSILLKSGYKMDLNARMIQEMTDHPNAYYYWNNNVLQSELVDYESLVEVMGSNSALPEEERYEYLMNLVPFTEHDIYHLKKTIAEEDSYEFEKQGRWDSAYYKLRNFYWYNEPPSLFPVQAGLGYGYSWSQLEPETHYQGAKILELDRQIIEAEKRLVEKRKELESVTSQNDLIVNENAYLTYDNQNLKRYNDTLRDDKKELTSDKKRLSNLVFLKIREVFYQWLVIGALALFLGIAIWQWWRAKLSESRAVESERIERIQAFTISQLGHTAPNCIKAVMGDLKEESREYMILDKLQNLLDQFQRIYTSERIMLSEEVELINMYLDLKYPFPDDGKLAHHQIKYEIDQPDYIPVPTFALMNVMSNAYNYGDILSEKVLVDIRNNGEYIQVKVISKRGSRIKAEKDSSTGLKFIDEILRAWNGSSDRMIDLSKSTDDYFVVEYEFLKKEINV